MRKKIKKQKNLRKLKITFYALIIIFILIMANMFFLGMEFQGIARSIVIFLTFSSWILFFLLGIVLIILAVRSKVKGKLKIFLMLTGISSTAFFIGVVFHNVFYALAIIFEGITILKYLMEALHVIFFFVSVPISPIGFLVGVIGSIILFKRGKKKKRK